MDRNDLTRTSDPLSGSRRRIQLAKPLRARIARTRVKLVPGVSGFTLLEILIAIVVAAALAAIAIPVYNHYVDQAKIARAKTTIAMIATEIESYKSEYNTYPPNLDALNGDVPSDPWGHPYQYLAIDVIPPPKPGKVLKDKSLHPLNSDFDLYSLGADGETTKQIASRISRDDIVRAANGGFIGLASDY